MLQTLCRLWVGTPLSDQRWAQALQIFEQELGDQGLGTKRNKARRDTSVRVHEETHRLPVNRL